MELIYLMRIFGSFWGGLNQGLNLLNFLKCNTTTILTNLGVLFKDSLLPKKNGHLHLGNAVLKKVELFPEGRPKTLITLCVLTYGDRLSITFNYNPRSFFRPDSEKFFEMFLGEIRKNISEQQLTQGIVSDEVANPAKQSLPIV